MCVKNSLGINLLMSNPQVRCTCQALQLNPRVHKAAILSSVMPILIGWIPGMLLRLHGVQEEACFLPKRVRMNIMHSCLKPGGVGGLRSTFSCQTLNIFSIG